MTVVTLLVQVFHVSFLARYKTVQNADNLLHCTAHWVGSVILQQLHSH